MSTIKEYLSADHERCDVLFASMEDAVANDIDSAKEAYELFAGETERHFQMASEDLPIHWPILA